MIQASNTNTPTSSRRSSKDLGNMLIQKLARIDWNEMEFIAAGGEGNVYKVPIYFLQDGEEKTRWCVLKKSKSEHNRSLIKEEDFNHLLTQADESSINHHIIKLIAHIDAQDAAYSLYPYCDLILYHLVDTTEHMNPLEIIKESNPILHTALVTQIGIDLLKAISHSHQSGVVHRDIKLRNIGHHLGKWCLLDWGLASDLLDGQEVEESHVQAGTVPYMHPKSFLEPGFGSTWHNDVYAFGRVLQFLMAQKVFDDVMNTTKSPIEFGYQEMKRFEKSKKDFPIEVPNFEDNCPSVTHDNGRQALQYLIDRMISLNPEEQPTLQQIEQKLSVIKAFIVTQLDIQNLNFDEELVKIHQHFIDSKVKIKPIVEHTNPKSSKSDNKNTPMVSSTFFSFDSSLSFFTSSSISSELSDTAPEVCSNDETTSQKPSVAN